MWLLLTWRSSSSTTLSSLQGLHFSFCPSSTPLRLSPATLPRKFGLFCYSFQSLPKAQDHHWGSWNVDSLVNQELCFFFFALPLHHTDGPVQLQLMLNQIACCSVFTSQDTYSLYSMQQDSPPNAEKAVISGNSALVLLKSRFTK